MKNEQDDNKNIASQKSSADADAEDDEVVELDFAAPLNLERDPIYDELSTIESCCEEYIELLRSSSATTINEFAGRYPKFKIELLELLPTVLMMEKARDRNLGKRKDGRVDAGPVKLTELNDFEIVRERGRGGMGIVYEAHQVSLDRRVALKVLPKHVLSKMQVEQFHREAATAAKLHHTNIAPVYGVGENDGVHYFAMQLIDGHTLESTARQKKLSVEEVVSIGRQAGVALQYAHDQGVFHRDIKPANLILDSDSHVWVTDFGLAVTKESFDADARNQVAGTVRYMPPEAFGKSKIDGPGYDLRTSDIYSLAITLVELLTTKSAFESSGVHELTDAIKKGRMQPLVRDGKRMHPDLTAVLCKAAAVDPAERYQSAREFVDDLENFSKRRPVTARTKSTIGQIIQWAKREPYMAFACSLAFVSVFSTTLVTTIAYLNARSSLEAERKKFKNEAAVRQTTRQNLATQNELVKQAVDFLEQLPDEQREKPEVVEILKKARKTKPTETH